LGYEDENQRGDEPNEMGNYLPFLDLGTDLHVQSVHAGDYHACAILSDDSFKCWGKNLQGQLGKGHTNNLGNNINEMGDDLTFIGLGDGVEVYLCFDLSPTSTPTITYDPTFQPTTYKQPSCLSKFAMYENNCVIYATSGVKCWGRNGDGQLGYGDTSNRGDQSGQMGAYLPQVSLGAGLDVVSISSSGHNCALFSNFSLKCWGAGGSGRLGYEDTLTRGDADSEMSDYLPIVNVGIDSLISQVHVGAASSLILTDNGEIKNWGDASSGQLGYGDIFPKGSSPSSMGEYLPFVDFGLSGMEINKVTTLDYSTCVLFSDLIKIKCYGYNPYGQLGIENTDDQGDESNEMGDYLPLVSLPSDISQVDALSSGHLHVAVISSQGKIYLWGRNDKAQLGLGQASNHIGDQPDEMGNYLENSELGSGSTILQFHGGFGHSCVILDSYQMKCFGDNLWGQLGYGDVQRRGDINSEMGDNLPVLNVGDGLNSISLHLGYYHTCVVLNSDQMKCFGRNDYGQLGSGDVMDIGNKTNQMGDYLPAVNLGSNVEVQLCTDISPTSTPTMVPTYNPSFFPTTTFSPTSQPTIYKQPSCFSRFTYDATVCILTKSQGVKCWGLNDAGQLGYGDTSKRGDSASEMGDYLPSVSLSGPVAYIASGRSSTCVKFNDFEVKCWGQNSYGSLGAGDVSARGNEQNEMGDYLPFVNLGTNIAISSNIYSGGYHVVVLTDSGLLKIFGKNDEGQLGYGDTENRGDNLGEMGDYLDYVDVGTSLAVIKVAPLEYSTCSLFDIGDLKCWGYNLNGQLGQGDTTNRGDTNLTIGDYLQPIQLPSGILIEEPLQGHSKTGVLTTLGSLYLWGNNNSGQLGIGSINHIGNGPNEMGDYLKETLVGSGRTTLEYQGGNDHSCVILDNFNVKCFGRSNFGQLGYGDTSTRGNLANQMDDYLQVVNVGTNLNAISLHLGYEHTCVVLNDDSFKCWGRNNQGQLGIGSTDNQGDEPNEMGDYLEPINLGTGVEIQLCFDYSPTLYPSISQAPSIFIQPSCRPSSRFSFKNHNCLLTNNDKRVKCFGLGSKGQLGSGSTQILGDNIGEMGDTLGFVNLNGSVASLHVGYEFNCVILSESLQVKCWGENNSGSLGYGDSTNRGDSASQMGAYLLFLDLGSNLIPSTISLSEYHGVVLTDQGRIKTWGNNRVGQLGHGDVLNKGDELSEMGDTLIFVDVGTNEKVDQVTTPNEVTCVLLESSSVKCFGLNNNGQLVFFFCILILKTKT